MTNAHEPGTEPAGSDGRLRLLIICERDVGLFSLFQQVVSNIPRALAEGRIPVVWFGDRCCYFTSSGYRGHDTMWEYYFEPLVDGVSTAVISDAVKAVIRDKFPSADSAGYEIDEYVFVSNHFGDHPHLAGKTLRIPCTWDDPDDKLRTEASNIIERYVRPRSYLREKADRYFEQHLAGSFLIGVHIRGTDAISRRVHHPHRKGSLNLKKCVATIRELLEAEPHAKVFVATDDQRSLDFVKNAFGNQVEAYDSIRHRKGRLAGKGPLVWPMPAYISNDRDLAARNGEEAVIEFLLLCRCNHLIHNGSGLARTVLLTRPELAHTNTHRPNKFISNVRALGFRKLAWTLKLLVRKLLT